MTLDSRSTARTGELLAGKYELLRLIGEGGMGVVYEAMHRRLGERVAIKLLRDQERQTPELVARFEREARTAAKLKSANVARIFDVDSLPDGTPFIVMEYLEGRDLDSELTERRRLPVAEAVGYLLQACSAVPAEPPRAAAEEPALAAKPVNAEPTVGPRASAELGPTLAGSAAKARSQRSVNALPSASAKAASAGASSKPTAPKPEPKDPGIPLTL